MERCQNGDLENFLRLFTKKHNGHMYSMIEKMRMSKEVASAMKYLHSLDVIHRDLKLQNVLITANEETRVMDFGLSKLALNTGMKQTMRVGASVYLQVLSRKWMCLALESCMLLTEKWMPYGEEMSVNVVENRVRRDPKFRPDIVGLEVVQLQDVDS